MTWSTAPCDRCGVIHPHYCDMCAGQFPCQDHICDWSDE